MTTILLILVVLAVVVFLVMKSQQRGSGHSATQLDDAKADARQSIERLGGQVYNLTGSDDASRQALADAAERYNAAGSQIDQAATPVQARLAKQTALEGLYYIRAARVAMGMDPGPEVPSIDGQKLPVRSPKTVRSNSRAARSPHHPIRRRTHPTTTPPAAESPDARSRPAGTPNLVEACTRRRRLGSGFDDAVLDHVLRHGRGFLTAQRLSPRVAIPARHRLR